MIIETQIDKGIMEAMKARDAVRLATLRNIKKHFIEAKKAAAGIGELPDADALKIIGKLAKQGADSAEIYRSQGREDLAAEEEAQVAVLRGFLPRQMSGEELAEALREIIAQTGAESVKDLGRVMAAASRQLAGKAEGSAISAKARELLS